MMAKKKTPAMDDPKALTPPYELTIEEILRERRQAYWDFRSNKSCGKEERADHHSSGLGALGLLRAAESDVLKRPSEQTKSIKGTSKTVAARLGVLMRHKA